MSRTKRVLLSCFILFNIVAILAGKNTSGEAAKLVYPYLMWTRLLQEWSLFVPTPRKLAFKYRVDITFKDGSTRSWTRPYPGNWDFFQRHLAYHFQRWDLATNRLESSKALWPGLAHYIERLYWDEQNPPVTIELVRRTAPRGPPREEGYVMQGDDVLTWSGQRVFLYDVVQKRFVE